MKFPSLFETKSRETVSLDVSLETIEQGLIFIIADHASEFHSPLIVDGYPSCFTSTIAILGSAIYASLKLIIL